ncbi:MAG: MFS transporter [Jatrophihabitantaceae bacterium]
MTLAAWLGTEPARPDRIRQWPGAPWLAVATVCVGAFMSQLDASIVTLALPALHTDLHAPVSAVAWVSLSYLLVLVGTVATVGRLADRAGRKLLYVYGFTLFTLASAGCGLARSLAMLIALRVLQAFGAALLQANSVALIRTTVTAGRLNRAIGVQGAAQALGLAAGPAIGGLLIAAGGWRWVFWVNLPIGALGIGMGLLLLPRTRIRAARQRTDWAGMLSLLATVGLLLLALSVLAGRPLLAATLLLAALGGAGVLVRIELRSSSPLIEPGLFARTAGPNRFTTGLLAALLSYLVLFGALVASPRYLQASVPASTAGLLITLLPLSLAMLTPVGALAADRFGTAAAGIAGLLLAGLGFLLPVGFGGAGVLPMLVLAGAGLGLFLPANNAGIAGSGRLDQAGLISGLLNMTRGIGTALGVAVATASVAVTQAAGWASPQADLRASMAVFAGLAGLAALAVRRG